MDDARRGTLAALFTAVQSISQSGALALGDLTASSTRQVLATLHREGDLSTGALAHRLRIAPPAIAQVAARLESRELIERRPDTVTGHGSLLHLTEAGAREVQAWLDDLTEALCPAFAHLTDDDWSTLARATDLLAAARLDSLAPDDDPSAGLRGI
ncbi:MarR family winged helix-turn-helix transcriptional regulator [Demequina iriomotensis]|uniref:MarR family winged helix-turn-helix transcriptional regulator n=1 Tax=Demequina iriomotensis TaxID=1536641 RepID=UPI0007853566|nr:MarR family transcriptional regulator [Demequina iriomotensis]